MQRRCGDGDSPRVGNVSRVQNLSHVTAAATIPPTVGRTPLPSTVELRTAQLGHQSDGNVQTRRASHFYSNKTRSTRSSAAVASQRLD